ncbi:MAG: hypothetical protein EOO39_19740 [Cytophagaceae bacterium]|nr:MAG: hypothetical protein EOO39_19740 [Cytophagaceae bacterium]
MQVIRQYAVPLNGILTIEVPKSFDGQQVEVQLVLAQEVTPAPQKKLAKRFKNPQLGKLVGKYKHYTQKQNDKIDNEVTAIRDEWERSI